MADIKTGSKTEKFGCKTCGDSRVMLSEEKDSPPKCAGCGKAVHSPKKN